MKSPDWTTKELAIIEKYYPEGGPSGCVQYLPGRTEAAILGKARYLGVRSMLNRSYAMQYDKDAKADNEETLKNERETIVGEIMHLMKITLYEQPWRLKKAYRCLWDAYQHQSLKWWYSKKEWKLGKWMELFVTGYEWDEQKNFIWKTTKDLHNALRHGGFEVSGVDGMIYQINDL